MNPRLLARIWSNEQNGWLSQDGRGYVAAQEHAGWFLPAFAHEVVSYGGMISVDGFEVPSEVALYCWTTEQVVPASW